MWPRLCIAGTMYTGCRSNVAAPVHYRYNVYELPIFIAMGVCGGLLGALFNHLNTIITQFRMKYVKGRPFRLTEALLIGLLTTCLAFTMMFFSDDCLPIGDEPLSNPLQLFCEDHQYSAMASLWFNTPEAAIRQLFHTDRGQYEMGSLVSFGSAYLLIACITYGIAVPSGLFVPCILTGAAWGRFLGTVIAHQYPDAEWSDPGKYALIGSAAFLGGVVRMTISLAVIVIEATGNITYSLPITATLVFAKWTGDLFNKGLYDIHIHIKHVPLLHWEPPIIAQYKVRAEDLMSKQTQTLRKVCNVGDLYDLLSDKEKNHGGYPVVEGEEEFVIGFILHSQLVLLLTYKAWGYKGGDNSVHCPNGDLTYEDFRVGYPRWPDISQVIQPNAAERDKWIDVSSYMNGHPHKMTIGSSFHRIFTMFRILGLRHLVIVDHRNRVCAHETCTGNMLHWPHVIHGRNADVVVCLSFCIWHCGVAWCGAVWRDAVRTPWQKVTRPVNHTL